MNRWFDIFETELGWIGLLLSKRGVCASTLPRSTPDQCALEFGSSLHDAKRAPQRIEALRERMQRYLAGEFVEFDDVPIYLGNAKGFQRAAWESTRSIAWGQTRSYQWIAEQAGNPRAARAAGQAMARNRIPILIPCHRVIGSHGDLGGYGGGMAGLSLKRRLLTIEGTW